MLAEEGVMSAGRETGRSLLSPWLSRWLRERTGLLQAGRGGVIDEDGRDCTVCGRFDTTGYSQCLPCNQTGLRGIAKGVLKALICRQAGAAYSVRTSRLLFRLNITLHLLVRQLWPFGQWGKYTYQITYMHSRLCSFLYHTQ